MAYGETVRMISGVVMRSRHQTCDCNIGSVSIDDMLIRFEHTAPKG